MSKKKVYYPYGRNDIAVAKIIEEKENNRALIKIKRLINANFPDEELFWRDRNLKKIVVCKDRLFENMEGAVRFLVKKSQTRAKELEDGVITYEDLCFFPLVYDVTCDIAARNAYFNSLKKIQTKLLSGEKLCE